MNPELVQALRDFSFLIGLSSGLVSSCLGVIVYRMR